MTDIAALTRAMHDFVRAKGWYDAASKRPQTPRNLAISLVLESSEVLELFQWGDDVPDKDAMAGELADVMLYLLQLASITDVDLAQAVIDKLRVNYGRTWDGEVKS